MWQKYHGCLYTRILIYTNSMTLQITFTLGISLFYLHMAQKINSKNWWNELPLASEKTVFEPRKRPPKFENLKSYFNHQLISWCSGVWQFFLAICPINFRYSGPKSAEKCQKKIQTKISVKILKFIRGLKGAPFDQFRCSQWP